MCKDFSKHSIAGFLLLSSYTIRANTNPLEDHFFFVISQIAVLHYLQWLSLSAGAQDRRYVLMSCCPTRNLLWKNPFSRLDSHLWMVLSVCVMQFRGRILTGKTQRGLTQLPCRPLLVLSLFTAPGLHFYLNCLIWCLVLEFLVGFFGMRKKHSKSFDIEQSKQEWWFHLVWSAVGGQRPNHSLPSRASGCFDTH